MRLPQGWWVPVIGGFAVYYTIKFNKLWKQYRKSGVVHSGSYREISLFRYR